MLMPSETPTGQTLVGEIARVAFRNPENGYSILKVSSQGYIDPVTVVCKSVAAEGEVIQAVGHWINHPKFGEQFQADRIMVDLPTSAKGIERYLSSGVVTGIGPGLAKRLVATFGPATLDVIESEPKRLLKIDGVGPKTLAKIVQGWASQREASRIVAALSEHEIGIGTALRIWRKFGGDALTIIKTDPFRLTEVPGVGFLTADAIAQTLGIPKDDPGRVVAGIRHALEEASERGHTGLAMAAFRKRTSELLGISADTIHDYLQRITTGSSRSAVTIGVHPEHGESVFLGALLAAEGQIARDLAARGDASPVWPRGLMSPERAREWTLQEAAKCGITLADAQVNSVVQAMTRAVSILTGGPGTGKTSTLKILLRVLERAGAEVVLGAPTGKAAKRMQETTGMEARTLARLIGAGHGSAASDVEIKGDILVIDEASMVDVRLMRDVLERMVPNMALLLVGDVDQLPSVGPGNVLGDLIGSGCLPTTRLTEIFRQAAQSAIVRNAHRVNRGEMPEPNTPGSDFAFVEVEDPEQISRKILQLVSDVIPRRFGVSMGDIQVLSPMRRGSAGVDALNAAIQANVNPNPGRKITRANRTFGVGDRVVQTVNNYDLAVMNGESGTVIDVREDDGIVVVDVDGLRVEYPLASLEQLSLAYAMTVHKSQGSQFPVVIVPVTTQHFIMLQRSITYTAMTRASRLCVFVGQKRALTMAVQNVNTEARVTMLRSCIEGLALLH